MASDVNNNACPDLHPERWVDDHADVLYRYAYLRVGERNTAEDLVQETFLAALEGIGRFDRRCSVQTWLISILRHKIADCLRQRGRDAALATEIDPDAPDFFAGGKWKYLPARWSANPEAEASKKEFWDRFIQCLRRLSPALADAFLLREMNLMEPNEICGQLDISDTGLWSRLHRARLNLRHCLEKNWFSAQSDE
jgi:RNA polymerase sigma-70 factor (ECF subfamily)